MKITDTYSGTVRFGDEFNGMVAKKTSYLQSLSGSSIILFYEEQ